MGIRTNIDSGKLNVGRSNIGGSITPIIDIDNINLKTSNLYSNQKVEKETVDLDVIDIEKQKTNEPIVSEDLGEIKELIDNLDTTISEQEKIIDELQKKKDILNRNKNISPVMQVGSPNSNPKVQVNNNTNYAYNSEIKKIDDEISSRKQALREIRVQKRELENQREIYKLEKVINNEDFSKYSIKLNDDVYVSDDVTLRNINLKDMDTSKLGQSITYKEIKNYLNEDQQKILAYYYNKYGKDKTSEYLKTLSDQITKCQAVEEANEFLRGLETDPNAVETIINHLKTFEQGTEDGVITFAEGLNNLFSETNAYSKEEYKQMFILEVLSQNEEYKQGIANSRIMSLQNFYEFGNSLGNMAPSIIASAAVTMATGGAGMPAAVAQFSATAGRIVGATSIFASTAGNSKHQAYMEGSSIKDSYIYGVMNGLSEAGLELVLGSLPGIGGESKSYLISMLKEGTEEGIQEIVSQIAAAQILGEDIDIEELIQNTSKSAFMGATMGGLFNIGKGVSNAHLLYKGHKLNLGENTINSITTLAKKGNFDGVIELLENEINKAEIESNQNTKNIESSSEYTFPYDLQFFASDKVSKTNFTSMTDVAEYFGDSNLYLLGCLQSKMINKELSLSFQENMDLKKGIATNDRTSIEQVTSFLTRDELEIYNKISSESNNSIQQKWIDSLSDNEKFAISSYAKYFGSIDASEAMEMYGYDSHGSPVSILELMRLGYEKGNPELDSALSKFGILPTEVTTYRSVGIDALSSQFGDINTENLDSLIGKTYKDAAYMSSSLLEGKAIAPDNSSANVLLKIKVPNDANYGAYIESMSGLNYGQMEFLIKRNSTSIIENAYVNEDGKIVVEMKLYDENVSNNDLETDNSILDKIKLGVVNKLDLLKSDNSKLSLINNIKLNTLYPELKSLNLDVETLNNALSNKNFQNNYKATIKPFIESLNTHKVNSDTIKYHIDTILELSKTGSEEKYIYFITENNYQNVKIDNTRVFADKNFEKLYSKMGYKIFGMENIVEIIDKGLSDRLVEFLNINQEAISIDKVNSSLFEDKVWNTIKENQSIGDKSIFDLFSQDYITYIINNDLYDGLKYTYENIGESRNFIERINNYKLGGVPLEQFSQDFINNIGLDYLKQLYMAPSPFYEESQYSKLFEIASNENYELIEDIINFRYKEGSDFIFNQIDDNDMSNNLLECNLSSFYSKYEIFLNKYLGIESSDIEYINRFLDSINRIQLSDELQEKYGSILNLLNKISSATDEEIIEISHTMNKNKRNEFKELIYRFEEDGNNALRQNFVEDLKQRNQDIVDNSNHKIITDESGNNIDIYELNGQPFTMLVHAITDNRMSSNNELVDILKDNPSKWSQIDDANNYISTSLINDSYTHIYGSKDGKSIIYGFNDLSVDNIKLTSPMDVGINRDASVDSNLNMRNGLFVPDVNTITTVDNLMEKTIERNISIKARQWNEIVLSRIDTNTGDSIIPDYILCFDYINENSKKAASEFGVPIYVIDSNMYSELPVANSYKEAKNILEKQNKKPKFDFDLQFFASDNVIDYAAINQKIQQLTDSGKFNEYQIEAIKYACYDTNFDENLIINPTIPGKVMTTYEKLATTRGVDISHYIEEDWHTRGFDYEQLYNVILADSNGYDISSITPSMSLEEINSIINKQIEQKNINKLYEQSNLPKEDINTLKKLDLDPKVTKFFLSHEQYDLSKFLTPEIKDFSLEQIKYMFSIYSYGENIDSIFRPNLTVEQMKKIISNSKESQEFMQELKSNLKNKKPKFDMDLQFFASDEAIDTRIGKSYNSYREFLDDIKPNRLNWKKMNIQSNRNLGALVKAYTGETITEKGNYKAVNGILRDTMFDFDKKKVSMTSSSGYVEEYTFDEFEIGYGMKAEEFYDMQLEAAEELSTAIMNNPLGKDIQFMRGVRFDALEEYGIHDYDSPETILEKLKEAGNYQDDGIMSCVPALPISNLPSILKSKPVWFELDVKGESGAIDLYDVNSLESEVLLQPGLVFEPVSVREEMVDIYPKIVIHLVQK